MYILIFFHWHRSTCRDNCDQNKKIRVSPHETNSGQQINSEFNGIMDYWQFTVARLFNFRSWRCLLAGSTIFLRMLPLCKFLEIISKVPMDRTKSPTMEIMVILARNRTMEAGNNFFGDLQHFWKSDFLSSKNKISQLCYAGIHQTAIRERMVEFPTMRMTS